VRVLVAACATALIASCFVDRRSNDFECETEAQCTGGRICEDGFCIMPPTPECPEDCNAGCDLELMTCNIGCSLPGQCDLTIDCPFGFECTINCSAPGACSNIYCDGAESCEIACTASNACGSIECGDGKCTVVCSTGNACGDVDCSQSCACDVACTGVGCDLSCPSVPASECTLDGTLDTPCSSTSQAGCSTCGS
jgi:hypothetical protein